MLQVVGLILKILVMLLILKLVMISHIMFIELEEQEGLVEKEQL